MNRYVPLVARNLIPIIAMLVAGRVLVQLAERLWPETLLVPSFEMLAYVIGGALALLLRARPAAYLIGAFFVFRGVELAAHVHWGIRSVQGAPTHFTVLGAAIAGVILGALLTRSTARPRPDPA